MGIILQFKNAQKYRVIKAVEPEGKPWVTAIAFGLLFAMFLTLGAVLGRLL